MTINENKTTEYSYEKVVIELDNNFAQAKINLEKNIDFPIIDVDALMDNLFEIIQTDEAYGQTSREGDIDYLLQETFAVGQFDKDMVNSLRHCVDVVITSVLYSLHKTGAFIDGLQPYSFSEFIDNKTILLKQSKVFSHRAEQYTSMDTGPRRDFIF